MKGAATAECELKALQRGLSRARSAKRKVPVCDRSYCLACERVGYDHPGPCDESGSLNDA